MKNKLASWPWLFVLVALALSAQGAQAQRPAALPAPDGAGPTELASALARGEWPSAPAGGPDFSLPDGCNEEIVLGDVLASLPIAEPPASNSVVTATLNITQSVPYAFAIASIMSISHTSPGDLVIDLISPDGTDVTL